MVMRAMIFEIVDNNTEFSVVVVVVVVGVGVVVNDVRK